MMIRRAEEKDSEKVLKLLGEVLKIHEKLRPDIFVPGTTKYTKEQLTELFEDDTKPVFVATDDADEVVGYAFCVMEEQPAGDFMRQFKTLYIDDLCVDADERGKHIGQRLFEYVTVYAKQTGCYDVTLNVWEGNDSARNFYKKMGMFDKKTMMEIIL